MLSTGFKIYIYKIMTSHFTSTHIRVITNHIQEKRKKVGPICWPIIKCYRSHSHAHSCAYFSLRVIQSWEEVLTNDILHVTTSSFNSIKGQAKEQIHPFWVATNKAYLNTPTNIDIWRPFLTAEAQDAQNSHHLRANAVSRAASVTQLPSNNAKSRKSQSNHSSQYNNFLEIIQRILHKEKSLMDNKGYLT